MYDVSEQFDIGVDVLIKTLFVYSCACNTSYIDSKYKYIQHVSICNYELTTTYCRRHKEPFLFFYNSRVCMGISLYKTECGRVFVDRNFERKLYITYLWTLHACLHACLPIHEGLALLSEIPHPIINPYYKIVFVYI